MSQPCCSNYLNVAFKSYERGGEGAGMAGNSGAPA